MGNIAVWLVLDLPLQKPACWTRRWESTASFILFSGARLNALLKQTDCVLFLLREKNSITTDPIHVFYKHIQSIEKLECYQ